MYLLHIEEGIIILLPRTSNPSSIVISFAIDRKVLNFISMGEKTESATIKYINKIERFFLLDLVRSDNSST